MRVDEVLQGMGIKTLIEEGEWMYIATDYRYKGWIKRHYLIPKTDSHSHYVKVAVADVLTEPKVQAALLICLTLGCTVQVISEEKSGWVQVSLADGSVGSIRSAFLEKFPQTLERDAVCQSAKLYLNSQYRWGGKSPLGIDCSGLCFMAYWLNGMHIYRDAKIVPDFAIKEISPDSAGRGDLLFFPGHVGMLIENDLMIHSSESGNGVKIEVFTQEWKNRLLATGSCF